MLAAQVPGEIVLGQLEPGDDRLRVLDVRGAPAVGIERGQMLPLTTVSSASGLGPDSTVLEGASGIDDLDAAYLKSIGLEQWIALPLEMSDGAIVGIVAAVSRRQGDYQAEHVVLLGLAARMLAYEWERVQTRTELRELRAADRRRPRRRRPDRPARPGSVHRPARPRVEACPPRDHRLDGGLLPGGGPRRTGRLAGRRAGAQGRRRGARRRGAQHRPDRPGGRDGPRRGDGRLPRRGRGRGARAALRPRPAPGHPRPPGRGQRLARRDRAGRDGLGRGRARAGGARARRRDGLAAPTAAPDERRAGSTRRRRGLPRRARGDARVHARRTLGLPQRRDRRAGLCRARARRRGGRAEPARRQDGRRDPGRARRRSPRNSSPVRPPSAAGCPTSTWPSSRSTRGPCD